MTAISYNRTGGRRFGLSEAGKATLLHHDEGMDKGMDEGCLPDTHVPSPKAAEAVFHVPHLRFVHSPSEADACEG
ncbi:hypothetical protein N5079_34080, partial [Planotetraspora sp. A-T 1434]|uniref:hypothetical protein n=1 Tax=Planotetraspora sp. A-T 1434 TaxID=2979219 RepID=UPI0021BDFF63